MNETTTHKCDVYQLVTDRIIAALEAGTVPWHMPWSKLSSLRNMRGTGYHGMNVLLLGSAGMARGYTCNTWATFNQIRQAGGMVNKGEHGTPVVFWHFFEVNAKGESSSSPDGSAPAPAAGAKKTIPMLRYYTVFNLEQQTGVAIPTIPVTEHNPIAEAETMLEHFADHPPIGFAPGRAFYSPGEDRISVPPIGHYQKTEEYYSTLFHECIHSTGHEKRLARKAGEWTGFGSESYSKEELVAEIGAAFLCAETGIVNQTIDNSAAYIASWLGRLKNDKRLVVTAAGAAQKAAQYIAGKSEPVAEPAAA
jgi:antirestriction protein ArdC